jgi:hypothetical protein
MKYDSGEMPRLTNHSRYDVYSMWCEGHRLAYAIGATHGVVGNEADTLRTWSVRVNGLLDDSVLGPDRAAIFQGIISLNAGTEDASSRADVNLI